ncbi:hypothetical protein JZ751_019841 [Albula glossodonta]|uniref:RRP12-like protein n=1 Tax=Albula glossodonta TaxID=121402 RepID=A0A8T2NXG5_9TELE|nr:hypothetical protein JZ751_019841 [Albula glossodonta]
MYVNRFELVKSMLPEEHHKVLSNIRKAEARSKRRKLLQKDDDEESESEDDNPKAKGESIEEILAESDSDNDSEDEKPKKGQKKPARQKGQAWLKEGETDEPLNFLDPKVSQRVLAGGSGIHRPLSQKGGFGADYRAKGKGDIKKQGKCDPYAYIPLKKDQLNRRKQAKLHGQFKGLVRGAQKGARLGRKMQRSKRKA